MLYCRHHQTDVGAGMSLPKALDHCDRGVGRVLNSADQLHAAGIVLGAQRFQISQQMSLSAAQRLQECHRFRGDEFGRCSACIAADQKARQPSVNAANYRDKSAHKPQTIGDSGASFCHLEGDPGGICTRFYRPSQTRDRAFECRPNKPIGGHRHLAIGKTILGPIGALALAASLSACASNGASLPPPSYLTTPDAAVEQQPISDPNEKFNRSVFENNQEFNTNYLFPIAKAYTDSVPEDVRDRVDAFSVNLSEPMVFANNILQLRFQAAATTFGRFVLNSTFGIAGLFDVAVDQNLAHQSGDFGQTLYVWGVRESDYLVLPVLGPTNVRDAVGSIVDAAAQFQSTALAPAKFTSVLTGIGTTGSVSNPLSKLNQVDELQTLEESSVDFYALLRSVTDQKRQAELREALETSALTGTPPVADPNAIEPVMTIVSSPTLLEKPASVVVLARKQAPVQATLVVVGAPKGADVQAP